MRPIVKPTKDYNNFIILQFKYGLVLLGLMILTNCSIPRQQPLVYTIYRAPLKDFAIVTLYIPYHNRSAQDHASAHLWEHLALRSLRQRYPEYLFAGQTRPDCLVLECATFSADCDKAFSILTQAVLNPNQLEQQIDCEKKIIALEHAQYSFDKSSYDSSLLLKSDLLDFSKPWDVIISTQSGIPSHHTRQQSSTLHIKSLQSNRAETSTTNLKINKFFHTNHADIFDTPIKMQNSFPIQLIQASAVAQVPNLSKEQGHILTMYLTQQLYQTWITSGYAYQASAYHDVTKQQLWLWVIYSANTPKPSWPVWLQNARYEPYAVYNYRILRQRAWLYCCKNDSPDLMQLNGRPDLMQSLDMPSNIPFYKQSNFMNSYYEFQSLRDKILNPSLWKY